MEKQRKVALVTGGSRGIGRGIALKLAENQYDVAFTYVRTEEIAQSAAAQMRQYGCRCLVMQASLEQENVAADIVRRAIAEYGRLDLLVNNAGLTIRDSILDMPLDDINLLINLNFKAYILTIQTAAAFMKDHQIKGNIINITSSRGERAYPGDALYGGLKAGINRAIQSIALDLAPFGIRVNNIAPGATVVRDTAESRAYQDKLAPRIPLGRIGTPEDIAEAVLWLSSEKASYITGVTLRVDGGLILPGMPESVNDPEDYGWGYVWPKKQGENDG